MTEKIINEAFVEVLNNKIPKKTQLADFIAETLSIEKETAYRRLRGMTMFTFNEVATLAKKLNFSIDEIILNSEKDIPFTNMMLKSFYNETNTEVNEWEMYATNYMQEFVDQDYSEFGMALKTIPYPILLPYGNISRYYKYKYIQHANNPSRVIHFKEIDLSDWKKENTDENYLQYQEVSHTIYIWDKKIIPIIVDDIKYFRSLGIMDDEDVKILKDELFLLVNELELTAARGTFKSTGNKIDIYISDEDIDSTYTYLWSEKICLSILITHLSYTIMSFNNKSKCMETKDWVTSMKYNSTLISGTGGRERVLFFNQQREAIETL